MDRALLAARLRELAGGWLQRDLAAAVGLRQCTISQYLNGRSAPSLDTLAAFAVALETSADYLLGITDDPRPPEAHPSTEHTLEVVIRTRDDRIEEAAVRRVKNA